MNDDYHYNISTGLEFLSKGLIEEKQKYESELRNALNYAYNPYIPDKPDDSEKRIPFIKKEIKRINDEMFKLAKIAANVTINK